MAPSRAGTVNGLRQHLLAHTRLAEEQHRGIRRCYLVSFVEDTTHPLAVGDGLAIVVASGDLMSTDGVVF